MQDELRAKRSRPHQLVQHARLNGVCAAHQRTGLFSTAKCEAEIIKNDEALHEVWGKKGGCPHKACPRILRRHSGRRY